MSDRTVHVTPAQKSAAQGLIVRSAKTGRAVSDSVAKIANARSATRTAIRNAAVNSNGSAPAHS